MSKLFRTLGEIVVSPVALVAGLGSGIKNVVTKEGTFEKGLDETMDKVIKVGGDVGDKHGETIAVGVATAVLGGAASKTINGPKPPSA